MSGKKGSSIRVDPEIYYDPRAIELRKLNSLRSELNRLTENARRWSKQLDGLQMPSAPVVEDVSDLDTEGVKEAASRLRAEITEYKREIRRFVTVARQKQVAENAKQEEIERLIEFGVGMATSAEDLVGYFGDAEFFDSSARQNQQLLNIRNEADALLHRIDGKRAISGQCARLFGEILASTSVNVANVKLRQLETQVEREANSIDKHEREEQTRWAASQMAETLREMGYHVSTVEESAFIKDGRIYAVKPNDMAHPLNFAFDSETGQVVYEPTRMVDGAPNLSRAEQDAQRRADAQADKAFCSPTGIGELRRVAAERGVDLKFQGQHEPGAAELSKIQRDSLLTASPTLQALYEQDGGVEKLKTRTHDDERN